VCMSLQLSSVKSQLEDQRVRLEKTHSDEMEKLLQNVLFTLLSFFLSQDLFMYCTWTFFTFNVVHLSLMITACFLLNTNQCNSVYSVFADTAYVTRWSRST